MTAAPALCNLRAKMQSARAQKQVFSAWEPFWRLLRALLRASWGVLGALGGLLGVSWGLLGPLGRLLGAALTRDDFCMRLGSDFEATWRQLGAVLGPSWGRLGSSWGRLGDLLGRLGTSWAVLVSSWSRLDPSWGHHAKTPQSKQPATNQPSNQATRRPPSLLSASRFCLLNI